MQATATRQVCVVSCSKRFCLWWPCEAQLGSALATRCAQFAALPMAAKVRVCIMRLQVTPGVCARPVFQGGMSACTQRVGFVQYGAAAPQHLQRSRRRRRSLMKAPRRGPRARPTHTLLEHASLLSNKAAAQSAP